MFAALVDNRPGLWWVALWATIAGSVTVWGALRGAPSHRVPRILLGVAVLAVAGSYWWEMFALTPVGPSDMRRGAGYVLWPALAWTAWSGVTYGRRVAETVRQAVGIIAGEDDEK